MKVRWVRVASSASLGARRQNLIGPRIAPDCEPAPTARDMKPSLGCRAIGIGVHERAVEIAFIGVPSGVRRDWDLAMNELFQRTRAAMRTRDPNAHRLFARGFGVVRSLINGYLPTRDRPGCGPWQIGPARMAQ